MVAVALAADVMLGSGVNEMLRSMAPGQPWGRWVKSLLLQLLR